jgi:hypothetical protein
MIFASRSSCYLVMNAVFSARRFLYLHSSLFSFLQGFQFSVFFWPWSHESEVWVYLIPKVIYPLNNMTFCCSIYLTVMLAWERYLAVCHPNHYRTVNTVQAGYTRILLIHVLPVVLFSVILNLPKFLETEFFYEHR